MHQTMAVAPRVLGRTWSITIAVLMVSLVAAVAGGVLNAPAAAAHGGPYELEVHSDGAGGLQVFAYYEEDGHIVEAIMDPVATAVSADGVERGPVTLISSAEGQGRWITEEPFLDSGDWTVTVSTTTPEETSTTVEFTVEPVEPTTEPETEEIVPSPEPTATSSGLTTGSDDAGGISPWVLAIVAGAAALVAVVVVIALRRRGRSARS